MSRFRYHFFVCTNARPPFAKPSCATCDSNQLLTLLKETVEERGLAETVKVTGCGCLGPCEDGAVMVVYPAGIWYKNVSAHDIPELVEWHILQDKPVTRLLYHFPDFENS